MSLHQGYVQKIQNGGWFAVCPTCGHDLFVDRATREAAEVDALEHQHTMDARRLAELGLTP
jgi:hypothetical protein